jgi:hypothetical protein
MNSKPLTAIGNGSQDGVMTKLLSTWLPQLGEVDSSDPKFALTTTSLADKFKDGIVESFTSEYKFLCRPPILHTLYSARALAHLPPSHAR